MAVAVNEIAGPGAGMFYRAARLAIWHSLGTVDCAKKNGSSQSIDR